MSARVWVAAWLLAFTPVGARAQYQMVSPMLYEGPRISLQAHGAAQAPAGRAPPVAARPVDAGTLRYRPDLERRRANLARFVARSRAADRAAGDSLAQVFAAGDVFELMKPELAKFGLGPDNVADAYTVWWITAWQTSRGVNDDVSPAVAAAVRRQFLEAAAATPQLAAARDGDKQDMSESLLIQAMLLSAAVSQAKANPKQMPGVKAGAVQAGRSMGVDLAGMELTERGFVTRTVGS